MQAFLGSFYPWVYTFAATHSAVLYIQAPVHPDYISLAASYTSQSHSNSLYSKMEFMLGMMTRAFNPSTVEVEAGFL